MAELKLKVTRPDGTVLEIPVTSKQLDELVSNVSSGGTSSTSVVVTQPHEKRRGKKADDDFPTDERLLEALRDGAKTVNDLGQRFYKRNINAHTEAALWHRLYGAMRRLRGDVKAQ